MEFIDIHGHYAWGIDDGIQDQLSSIQALQIARDNHITTIAATPHVVPGMHTSIDIERFKKRIHEFKKIAFNNDICVVEGCELFLNHDYLSAIQQGIIIPYENTNYVLVEFDVRHELGEEYEVEDRLYEISRYGYRIVIAHVERYFKDDIDLERIKDLIDSGYVIQINATSLLGYHGKTIQKNAYALLNKGLVHIIASDTHRSEGRRIPCLQMVYDVLAKKYDDQTLKTLMFDNPRHVLNNEDVEEIQEKTSFFKKLWKGR